MRSQSFSPAANNNNNNNNCNLILNKNLDASYCSPDLENSVFQSFENRLFREFRQRTPDYKKQSIIDLIIFEGSIQIFGNYDVCISGSLSTSSLKLYLIRRYISSPRVEKSTEMS